MFHRRRRLAKSPVSSLVESLEPRYLLAGNVIVDVDEDGNVTAIGDDGDNHFTFIGLPNPNGGDARLFVIPNETSINGEDSSRPVFLGNFARPSFFVDPGLGADVVGFENLTVETVDVVRDDEIVIDFFIGTLTLDLFNVHAEGDMRFTSGGSPMHVTADTVSAASFSVDIDVDQSLPPLVPLPAVDLGRLTLAGLDVAGDLTIASDSRMDSISMRDVDADGTVSLNTAGLTKLTVSNVNANGFVIADAIRVERLSPIVIDVSDMTLRESFDIDADGPIKLVADNVTTGGNFSTTIENDDAPIISINDPAPEFERLGISNIRLRDLYVEGAVSVSTDGPTDLAVNNIAAGQISLQFESSRNYPAGYDSVVSVAAVDVDGELRVNAVGPLSLTADTVSAASAYFDWITANALLPESVRPFSSIPYVYGDNPVVRSSSLTLTNLNVNRDVLIQSDFKLELIAEQLTAGGDLILDVDNRSDTPSSVQLRGLHVAGGLGVHSRGAFNFTFEDVMAHHVSTSHQSWIDVSSIDFGQASLLSTSVQFSRGFVASDFNFESQGRFEFAAANLTIGRNMNLVVPDITITISSPDLGPDALPSSKWLLDGLIVGGDVNVSNSRLFVGNLSFPVDDSASLSVTDAQIGGNLNVQLDGGASQFAAADLTIGRDLMTLSLEHSTIGGDVVLDIDNRSFAKSTVQLNDLAIGESLYVSTRAAMTLTASRIQANDVHIVSGGPRGHSLARNVYLFQDSNLSGDFCFEHVGSGDLLLEITDTLIAGGLFVDDASTAQIKLHFAGMEVGGLASIHLGDGPSDLTILDFIFCGFAEFDGGEGDDLLFLGSDVVFKGGSRFLNFESQTAPGTLI